MPQTIYAQLIRNRYELNFTLFSHAQHLASQSNQVQLSREKHLYAAFVLALAGTTNAVLALGGAFDLVNYLAKEDYNVLGLTAATCETLGYGYVSVSFFKQSADRLNKALFTSLSDNDNSRPLFEGDYSSISSENDDSSSLAERNERLRLL